MKILFLYADDTYFWRNRLSLAREAIGQGFEVVLLTPVSNYLSEIEKVGIRVIPWNLSRKSVNPFRELPSLIQVLRVYRRERPDVVQHETLKAVIHGGIAARLCGNKPSVNVVCGLGSIFTRPTAKMKFLRAILMRILPVVFANRNSRVVFMNEDNRKLLLSGGAFRAEQASMIPGVGVCLERFVEKPEPGGVPIVLLPSRMLWEKGVGEFVAAATELRREGISARFVLAGTPDIDNPGFIPQEQLKEWARSGAVEWWGQCDDMPSVYTKSTIVCLPSYYGEGLPNVLTEAGACGRAVVTTDVAGCREVVRNEVNGLLVPPRDSKALGAAIRRLLDDAKLRKQLAAGGRQRAEREFASEVILARTLDLYGAVLGGKWPTGPGTDARASKAAAGFFSRV
jgi:glycosyltransferase involved in cell wall biosynthesis